MSFLLCWNTAQFSLTHYLYYNLLKLYCSILCSDDANAIEIVDNLVTYLALSEEAIREEIVLKIAILSERCNTNWTWYLDTMLNVLVVAGDFVPVDAWHRIIHVIANNKVR